MPLYGECHICRAYVILEPKTTKIHQNIADSDDWFDYVDADTKQPHVCNNNKASIEGLKKP